MRVARRGATLWVGVAVTAAVGIVLRLVLYRSTAGTLDGDDGVVGLMTKHAAHGHIPLLFWGQDYGGTQEVVLTAPLFLVFGPSAWALRAEPLLLTALTAVLVWRIGLRTSNPVSAVTGACLFWVAPAYLIYKTTHQHGFYSAGLVWSAAILLLVLRAADECRPRDAVVLGLALGLAWWETPQIVTVAVPALTWLVWRRPACLRLAWLIVPAALLGMAPWIVWNARHNWESVTNPPGAGNGEPLTLHSYFDHVRAYVSALTPMNLDLRVPFASSWTLGKLLAEVVYAVLLIAFAALGWRRRSKTVSLLVAVMVCYPLMYALSPASWNAAEPRYALLSLPALALLLAYPIRTWQLAVAAVAVAVALTGLTLRRMDPAVQVMPGVVNPRHYDVLISDLGRHHVDRVYCDYWVAYRLTFVTNEQIVAAFSGIGNLRVRGGRVVAPDPDWSRNWSYNRLVDAADRVAIVFVRGDPAELAQRSFLTRRGYERDTPGRFVVYLPPAPTPRRATPRRNARGGQDAKSPAAVGRGASSLGPAGLDPRRRWASAGCASRLLEIGRDFQLTLSVEVATRRKRTFCT